MPVTFWGLIHSPAESYYEYGYMYTHILVYKAQDMLVYIPCMFFGDGLILMINFTCIGAGHRR